MNMQKQPSNKRLFRGILFAILIAAVLLLGQHIFHVTHSVHEDSYLIRLDNQLFGEDGVGPFSQNFAKADVDDFIVEFYRVGNPDDKNALVEIYPYLEEGNSAGYPGFIRNISGKTQINSIEIAFHDSLDGSEGTEFELSYGNDRNKLQYSEILSAKDFTGETYVFDEPSSYFCIAACGNALELDYLVLHFNDVEKDESTEHYVQNYRYVPTVNYSPEEGDTLTAPYSVTSRDDGITVNEVREYTYHSFDYCKEAIEAGADPEEFAITDPIDIANYFVLFNRIPPNFGYKDENVPDNAEITAGTVTVEEAEEVFHSLTRQFGEYSRTDGYCINMPYNCYPADGNAPLYYEFDIALSEEYDVFTARGTGRIIGYTEGFYTNEDNTNVAFYTDDHYLSMMEYSNYGFWNERFDTVNYLLNEAVVTGLIYNKEESAQIIERKKTSLLS